MRRVSAVLVVSALMSTPAAAQLAQTWVSPAGNDTNSCAFATPCRTFQGAHNKTIDGGALNVRDSGEFGQISINRSISIVADGVEGLIVGSNVGPRQAITIKTIGVKVVLRGLTIIPAPISDTGIYFEQGATLHVERCSIRMPTGIQFQPRAASELFVSDTMIESSRNGILVSPIGTGGAKVTIDRVRIAGNGGFGGGGFVFTGTTNASVGDVNAVLRDSVATGLGDGVSVRGSGSSVIATVERTLLTNNGFGARASTPTTSPSSPPAILRIGNSTITGNNTGLSVLNRAAIESYGTNKLNGNGVDGAPTRTIARK